MLSSYLFIYFYSFGLHKIPTDLSKISSLLLLGSSLNIVNPAVQVLIVEGHPKILELGSDLQLLVVM